MTEPFFEASDAGLKLFVRVTPKSSKDALEGLADDGAGRLRLKAKVRAVPEDGKANAALEKLVAKRFGVPKSAASVVAGPTSRSKTVLIEGDPGALSTIARLLEMP
ncbi:DUF167 family protein [Fulvimarina sp. MAC3]|uniref:DUF167 domain-containing protein n=1 Tax=Fulvimarina sp. MAC3 TaxID=3148887 RepID=UPI0031FDD41E